MSVVCCQVGGCFVGLGRAYIYVLFSKSQHALYVGQTNDRNGVIGRLNAHVAPDGTFRMRLYQAGIDLDELDDLSVFSYRLPDNPRYTGVDRTYREGVEWLVQKLLQDVCGELRPWVRIVSKPTYSSAADLASIVSLAESVFQSFRLAYEQPSSGPPRRS